ncbi:MAG: hypothetical protein J6D07_06730 [Mogibacterium sp.]|nr:hypothetical protein [Mogibacterium sp.]
MKNSAEKKIIAFLIGLMLLFLAIVVLSAVHAYRHRMDTEKFDELDMYSMHEYSRANSEKALQALKEGNSGALEKLLISNEGLADVTGFAEWSGIDMDNLVSMGSGSLSSKADSKGRIDISERWIAETADGRYVFFIETRASRWGRKNDGISAIAVTSFDHFDELDYGWNGKADESSALAGKLFWPTNQ